MPRYQVVVGNVGTVVDTDDHREAIRAFHAYVFSSSQGEGRCGLEDVVLMRDGEPWAEYHGEGDA